MSQNAYYPAGVTDARIDAYWGNTYRADSRVEEFEEECESIRQRMAEIDRKELYLKALTPEEEEEYSELEDRLAYNEKQIDLLSDYDWDEDDKWQRADAMINERLGK